MRIIALNVNGIRSAARKGLFQWLSTQQADFVCLQEIRAQPDQLQDPLFQPAGYHCFYAPALKKGYSGVGLYSRLPPDRVITDLGWSDFQAEGRYLEVQIGNLSVVSLYLPSGSSGPERQSVKYAVMDRLTPFFDALRQNGRDYIFCGDWNIAHKPIDLRNWRSNQKNSGFLPRERAWLDHLFEAQAWVDAFRVVNKAGEEYTWWSNRGQAWANNVGWRIDYHIVSPSLEPVIRQAAIYKAERFSDHAPLTLDYDYPLPA